MISKIVDFHDMLQAKRWRVELFTDISAAVVESRWPLVPIGELADESSDAILPTEYHAQMVLYVGLENVESVTGEPVGLEVRAKASVKSRSKTFNTGYILYGRLRPYLRKAFLAQPPFAEGICSTEFIVMRPNLELVSPEVLRALLVSRPLTDELARFQIGAALPRISAKDFFSLRLPLPPLHIQEQWAEKLAELSAAIREARQRLDALPHQIDACLDGMVKGVPIAAP